MIKGTLPFNRANIFGSTLLFNEQSVDFHHPLLDGQTAVENTFPAGSATEITVVATGEDNSYVPKIMGGQVLQSCKQATCDSSRIMARLLRLESASGIYSDMGKG